MARWTSQLHIDDQLQSTWVLSTLKSMYETSSNQKKITFESVSISTRNLCNPLWCFVIKHSKQHFLLQVDHLFLNFACIANFCLCVGTQGFPVDIGWECTRLGAIRKREAVQAVLPPVLLYGVVLHCKQQEFSLWVHDWNGIVFLV